MQLTGTSKKTGLMSFLCMNNVLCFFSEPQPTIGTNPLLEKLKEVLTQQYQNKPLSRCIIFVRTRPIAKVLINYLGEQSLLSPFSLNAKFLTGTNAKAEHFGEFMKRWYCALRVCFRLSLLVLESSFRGSFPNLDGIRLFCLNMRGFWCFLVV